jgi:SAM-dependent methyltransferase
MIKNDEIIEFYNTHGFDGGSTRRHIAIRKGLNRGVKPGGRAIDIGCGLGTITYYLAKCGMTVTGIDISDKKIEYANKNLSHKNATYVCSDFIEYESNSILDLIVLCDVFEHIEESRLPEFMNRLMRFADNSTKIYMNIPDGRFLSFLGEKYPERLQIIDVSHSIHNILEMFSEFGFGPLSIKIYGLGAPMQYNEIVFEHNESVKSTHIKTWKR